MNRWILARIAIAALLASCGDPPDVRPDGAVGRTFGEACEHSEECESGLCVATGPRSATCTRLCSGDAECPEGPSWGCVWPEGFDAQICGCVRDADEEICGDGIDNDCDGRTDNCRICDGRAVAEDDPRHCGGCGIACSADQRCREGVCECRDEGEVNCDGACVDLMASAFHCGECRRACGDARECVGGSCGCPRTRPDHCRVQGCVSFENDPMNCGGCDRRCPLNQTCEAGSCGCSDGRSYCGTSCVDLRDSDLHCGACGNACRGDTTCVGGECVCPTGEQQCGDRCVRTLTDGSNCGACGNVCPSGSFCLSGRCQCDAVGAEICGGFCIDTQSNTSHCGGCNNRCPIGSRCTRGTCQCTGMVCGDTCVSTSSDPTNCGSCGNACRAGEVCSSGACRCNSEVYCGELCMPQNDPVNCGACNNVCGVSQFCSSGACRCSSSGLTACGAACVNTRTDPAHCGGCGVACRADEICSNFACTCPTGQTYCESAGRCVDMRIDPANCGGCGVTCRATELCSGSTCRCPLSTQAWCDGACIDVSEDPDNCGFCGRACAADATCVARNCRCPVASHRSCGEDGCRDTNADPAHCGACGQACAAGQYCASGTCLCPVAIAGAPIPIELPAGPDLIRDAVFDGARLAAVYAYPFGGAPEPTVAWVDTAGNVGSRWLAVEIGPHDDVSRVRITRAASGWNVLLRVTRGDTPGPRHVLVRLASDGSTIATRGLDSAAAPWAHADLTYIPGVGPVVAWITGTPATAFVRRLNEDGSNQGGAVVLGAAEGVLAIAHDGADELAVSIANGVPTARLRTFFLSTGLSLLGTHDDTVVVAQNERPHLAGRDGQWLGLMRTSVAAVRVLQGARFGAVATRSLTRLQHFDWAEGELLVLSGGNDPVHPGTTVPALRRYSADTAFGAIDAELGFSTFRAGLGVARVSRTEALALFLGDEIYGVNIELSDCPR